MTQIQMFQPGKAFYDAFQQSRGNTLAKMAFQSQGDERKSALADLYGIDANAANTLEKGFNEQDKADFADFSRTILAMPDDLKPQIYAKGVQRFGHKFRQMGVEPPEDYTQALPLFQQAAGGVESQDPADVRSFQFFTQGMTPEQIQLARQKQLGINPPAEKWNYGQTPSGAPYRVMGDKYQVMNPQTRQWLDYGGQAQQEEGSVDFASLPPAEQEAVARIGNGFSKSMKIVDGKAVDTSPQGFDPFAPRNGTTDSFKTATPEEIASAGLPVGTSAQINTKTGEIKVINKPDPKSVTQSQAEITRQNGKVEMSRVLKTMLDEYKALDDSGGITNTSKSFLDNLGAYASASDTGQALGRIGGSKNQSARDTINAMKPQVLSAIIAASGMSAKQLDSNAEMKLWLSATSDPQTSYQTVLKVTDNLLKKFTGQGIEQFNNQQSSGNDKRQSLLDKY